MSKNPVNQQTGRPRITIAKSEHAVLTSLAERSSEQNSPVGDYLVDELSRAFIVPDEDCDPNVVRIGSVVTYREEASARVRTVTVVYPREANIDQQRVSVLTPVGAALIGMSPTQSIEWPTPDGGVEVLTVLDVKQSAS